MQPKTLATKFDKSQIPQHGFDPAVSFGDLSRDTSGMKSYPFFYGFTRFPYQEGIADPTTGVYSITGASAEGPDGLDLPAGGMLTIPIVMDDDTNFHLLYIKYGAFRVNQFTTLVADAGDTVGQSLGDLMTTSDQVLFSSLNAITGVVVNTLYFVVGVTATTFQVSLTSGGAAIALTGDGLVTWQRVTFTAGSREYLTYPYPSGATPASSLLLAGRNARIPYWTELDVAAYMTSSGGRDLYGGFQRQPILGATEEAPIPILDLQTAADGVGMIRTAFQLTKSATVKLRIFSRSAYPLRIYGHVFGYKITV